MKKIYLAVVCLLGVFIGFSFTQKVNAEILPVVGNPYAYDLDLEFEKIVSGEAHTLGLTTTGQLYAWGWNMEGQLGNDGIVSVNTPIEITEFLNLGPSETIFDIAAGALMSSCITSNGRVLMWGENIYGQLGDNTTTRKLLPTDITANFGLEVGETIVFIELGKYSSSAISSLGRVFAWGYNAHGQLGDGTLTNSSLPIDITANFNLSVGETIVKTAFDHYHSAAISSLNRVFTWGL
ncbi:MAG: RCC1 domain-containing protein, partial [Vulcanibacillus sp.]